MGSSRSTERIHVYNIYKFWAYIIYNLTTFSDIIQFEEINFVSRFYFAKRYVYEHVHVHVNIDEKSYTHGTSWTKNLLYVFFVKKEKEKVNDTSSSYMLKKSKRRNCLQVITFILIPDKYIWYCLHLTFAFTEHLRIRAN